MQFPKWEGGLVGDPISWIECIMLYLKWIYLSLKLVEIDENKCMYLTEDPVMSFNIYC